MVQSEWDRTQEALQRRAERGVQMEDIAARDIMLASLTNPPILDEAITALEGEGSDVFVNGVVIHYVQDKRITYLAAVRTKADRLKDGMLRQLKPFKDRTQEEREEFIENAPPLIRIKEYEVGETGSE